MFSPRRKASSNAGSFAAVSPYSTPPCSSNQSTPVDTWMCNEPGRRKILPSASMCQPASTNARTMRGSLAGASSQRGEGSP